MLENYIVSLPVVKVVDYDDVAGIDLDQAAADVARILVPFNCVVVRAMLIVTETCGGSTTGVVQFDRRPTAGSDASRGSADIANFAMVTTAAGKVLYDEVAKGTVLEAGDEIVVEITTRPTSGSPAGHFEPVLLVQPKSETLANMADMVATA
jgi:hypothetical protein